MTPHGNAPAAGTARGEAACRNEPRNFIRKRPPYSREFSPGPNRQAYVAVGWPGIYSLTDADREVIAQWQAGGWHG